MPLQTKQTFTFANHGDGIFEAQNKMRQAFEMGFHAALECEGCGTPNHRLILVITTPRPREIGSHVQWSELD